jgi:hypothetical protein
MSLYLRIFHSKKYRKICLAAEMAAEWWAPKLNDQYRHKQLIFQKKLTELIRRDLCKYGECELWCDYNFTGVLLEALRLTVNYRFSVSNNTASYVLPYKHFMTVTKDLIRSRDGVYEPEKTIIVYRPQRIGNYLI